MPPPIDGTANPVAPEEWWQRLARIGSAAGKSSMAPTRASMNYDIGRNVGSILGGLRKPKQPGVVSTQAKDPTIPPQSMPPGMGSSAQATNFVAPNTQQFDPTSQQLYGQVDEVTPSTTNNYFLQASLPGGQQKPGSSPAPAGGGGGSSANTPPFWPGQTWNYDPWGDPSSPGYGGGDNGPDDITIDYNGGGGGMSGGGGTGREDENPDQWDYQYMATGGEADEPTPVIIGEGGEEEFVVPKSKLKGFAASVEAGKPMDPKLLPSDDRGYSPVPDSMRAAMAPQLGSAPPPPAPGPPPMPMAANGPAPPPPGPPTAPAGPPPGGPPPPAMGAPGVPPRMGTPGIQPVQQAPQLPPVPQRKPPGILQRLGAAAIGGLAAASNAKGTRAPQIDASGAEQSILYPGYNQQMAEYQQKVERAKVQSELEKGAATSAKDRAEAGYYTGRLEQQRSRYRFDPKTGAAFDTETGTFVVAPKTDIDKMNERDAAAKAQGWTEETRPGVTQWIAEGKWGTTPAAVARREPVPAEWAQKNMPFLKPDAQGNYTADPEVIKAVLAQGKQNAVNNEYEGVVREFTDATGKTDWGKANAEYDRRLANRARESRPPNNTQGNFETTRSDKSYQFNIGELNKVGTPIEQLNARIGRLNDTLAQNSPQADALVAPELLTVMAGGQGSGLRMNEAEIQRIVGGRSQWENLKASINKWQVDPQAARSITPAQQMQIRALVNSVGQKLAMKQRIMDGARQQMLNTDDPAQHRRIVADTRDALTRIDEGPQQQPQQGNTGAAPTGGRGGGRGGPIAQKITVTAPDGSKHLFDTPEQAATFKKLAGIK